MQRTRYKLQVQEKQISMLHSEMHKVNPYTPNHRQPEGKLYGMTNLCKAKQYVLEG